MRHCLFSRLSSTLYWVVCHLGEDRVTPKAAAASRAEAFTLPSMARILSVMVARAVSSQGQHQNQSRLTRWSKPVIL